MISSGASGAEAKLDRDSFWVIPREERCNPYKQQTTTVGQLSELIERVSALDFDPGRVTRQHLIWLGDLLKAIGELASD